MNAWGEGCSGSVDLGSEKLAGNKLQTPLLSCLLACRPLHCSCSLQGHYVAEIRDSTNAGAVLGKKLFLGFTASPTPI